MLFILCLDVQSKKYTDLKKIITSYVLALIESVETCEAPAGNSISRKIKAVKFEKKYKMSTASDQRDCTLIVIMPIYSNDKWRIVIVTIIHFAECLFS